jgi:hypothetical protein
MAAPFCCVWSLKRAHAGRLSCLLDAPGRNFVEDSGEHATLGSGVSAVKMCHIRRAAEMWVTPRGVQENQSSKAFGQFFARRNEWAKNPDAHST